MSTVTPIASAAEKRDERRRQSTFSQMGAALHALVIETIEIAKLGDAERALRLKAFCVRLALVDLKADCLRRESLALGETAAEEGKSQLQVEGS